MAIVIVTGRTKAILGETSLSDPTIASNDAATVLFMTSVFSGVTIEEALLNELSAWYSAHLCRITERELSEENYSESDVAYYLSEGNFVKIARELDTSGTLNLYLISNKAEKVSAIEIGF